MTTPPNPRRRLAALPYYTALKGEDFTGADLVSTRTSQLRFTRCSFKEADLRHADLDGCSFVFCDLSRADLRGASLRGTHLSGCDLREADLRGADLTGTVFGRVNTGRPPHGLTDITGARLDDSALHAIHQDDVIGRQSAVDATRRP
ncbi:pentapeptide repeat-containing protein [Streptomyces sp. NPDC002516]